MKICCICGKEFTGFGNNPWPVSSTVNEAQCCDQCNITQVIPTRLKLQKLDKEEVNHEKN